MNFYSTKLRVTTKLLFLGEKFFYRYFQKFWAEISLFQNLKSKKLHFYKKNLKN